MYKLSIRNNRFAAEYRYTDIYIINKNYLFVKSFLLLKPKKGNFYFVYFVFEAEKEAAAGLFTKNLLLKLHGKPDKGISFVQRGVNYYRVQQSAEKDSHHFAVGDAEGDEV